MSGKLNFKGVEEAKDNAFTEPGTKDVFRIKEVKFDTTPNKGTYYMGVTFARKSDSFSHSFFLSEKALPRVKTLAKALGKELDEELSEEQLIKFFEGKDIALKVTAKFDETNGRAYADLAFGGFCKPVEKLGDLEFTDREKDDIARAKEMRRKSTSSEADAPSSKSTPATIAKGDDEIF